MVVAVTYCLTVILVRVFILAGGPGFKLKITSEKSGVIRLKTLEVSSSGVLTLLRPLIE